MLPSVKNEPVEDQFRLLLLQQVKDQLHLFKKTSRFFCEMIGTTYLAKPALCTTRTLKGPKSTIPCERQTHMNENWLYVACLRQETRFQHDVKHLGYH